MSEITKYAKAAREAVEILAQKAEWAGACEASERNALSVTKDIIHEQERKIQELTRQRDEARAKMHDAPTIDGQPIEYWHSIATSTLKTNDELIDRVRELKSTNDALVKCHQDQADSYTKRTDELIETRRRERVLLDQLREKERINADLEQQLAAKDQQLRTARDYEQSERARANNLDQQLKNTEIEARDTEKALQRMIDHQKECASKAQSERDAALRELDAMREKMNNRIRYTVDGQEVDEATFNNWRISVKAGRTDQRRSGWIQGTTLA